MRDALCIVSADQRFVQKLTLFMAHIGNEQAEKDVQLLDFCRQFRKLDSGAVQEFIDRPINLADLHNIDAVRACRGDLDKLAAHICTGAVKLVPLQGSDDENRDIFTPHS